MKWDPHGFRCSGGDDLASETNGICMVRTNFPWNRSDPLQRACGAMGLLRNLGKALVKQAFRDPAAGVTCWAKKDNAPEVARNVRKTLQNQWYLHVPHHFPQNGRNLLQSACRRSWDYCRTLRNRWENQWNQALGTTEYMPGRVKWQVVRFMGPYFLFEIVFFRSIINFPDSQSGPEKNKRFSKHF